MRRVGTIIGLVLVAVACGSGADMMGEILDSGVPDAAAQPCTGESMKFVGSSSGKVVPANGLFATYAACQQTFGAGHRMCTLAEILNTADMPMLATGPSIYQADLNSLPCAGWSETRAGTSPNFTSLYAPSVDELGKFAPKAAYCGNETTVACCGPK